MCLEPQEGLEFETTLDYIVRPYLETKQVNQRNSNAKISSAGLLPLYLSPNLEII